MKEPIVKLDKVTVAFRNFDTVGRSFKHRLAMLPFRQSDTKTGSVANQSTENVALTDVCLSVNSGARIAVLGGNASGKTSLLRAVGGLLAPQKGSIERTGLVALAMEIGVGTDLKLSVADTIRLQAILWNFSNSVSDTFIRETLRIGELGQFSTHAIQTLPPGIAGRLAVAMSIASNAPLLLFDEVFEHVDPTFAEQICKILTTKVHADRALLLVSRQRRLLETL
ncbi:MAG TPA: hypothetical protein DCS82_13365, partial [Rhodospirillaceae bacterium]|nr:hypothetical protein [Rhodospirillaceae bacterium]